MSVAQVVQSLQAQNLAAPVGRLNGALDERAIRLRGRLDTPEDFARLVIAERDGAIFAEATLGPGDVFGEQGLLDALTPDCAVRLASDRESTRG